MNSKLDYRGKVGFDGKSQTETKRPTNISLISLDLNKLVYSCEVTH